MIVDCVRACRWPIDSKLALKYQLHERVLLHCPLQQQSASCAVHNRQWYHPKRNQSGRYSQSAGSRSTSHFPPCRL